MTKSNTVMHIMILTIVRYSDLGWRDLASGNLLGNEDDRLADATTGIPDSFFDQVNPKNKDEGADDHDSYSESDRERRDREGTNECIQQRLSQRRVKQRWLQPTRIPQYGSSLQHGRICHTDLSKMKTSPLVTCTHNRVLT